MVDSRSIFGIEFFHTLPFPLLDRDPELVHINTGDPEVVAVQLRTKNKNNMITRRIACERTNTGPKRWKRMQEMETNGQGHLKKYNSSKPETIPASAPVFCLLMKPLGLRLLGQELGAWHWISWALHRGPLGAFVAVLGPLGSVLGAF